MAMRELREKKKLCAQQKGKEDKELVINSCKKVRKVKHVHKTLCLILPNIACSMN